MGRDRFVAPEPSCRVAFFAQSSLRRYVSRFRFFALAHARSEKSRGSLPYYDDKLRHLKQPFRNKRVPVNRQPLGASMSTEFGGEEKRQWQTRVELDQVAPTDRRSMAVTPLIHPISRGECILQPRSKASRPGRFANSTRVCHCRLKSTVANLAEVWSNRAGRLLMSGLNSVDSPILSGAHRLQPCFKSPQLVTSRLLP